MVRHVDLEHFDAKAHHNIFSQTVYAVRTDFASTPGSISMPDLHMKKSWPCSMMLPTNLLLLENNHMITMRLKPHQQQENSVPEKLM